MNPLPDKYKGRFAPSPSGPLHMGSLIAAVASYLDARAHQGIWLVRIEDIDPPREVAGASDAILRSLEAHGLTWDGDVLFQSTRLEAYRDTLQQLAQRELVYPCDCSRAKLREIGGIYPGTCRKRGLARSDTRALRLRVDNSMVSFNDRIQGLQEEYPADTVGDFIVERKGGLVAYQLAVVVDDAHTGITDIVRGADLLDSSARQIYLQSLLNYATPRYAHFPVITDQLGLKLSKQAMAPSLDDKLAIENLVTALAFLGQPLPDELPINAHELLAFATRHWQLQAIPPLTQVEQA